MTEHRDPLLLHWLRTAPTGRLKKFGTGIAAAGVLTAGIGMMSDQRDIKMLGITEGLGVALCGLLIRQAGVNRQIPAQSNVATPQGPQQ